MAKSFFISRKGQSIFDLAMMAYGDYSRVFQLIAENPDLQNTTRPLPVGTKIYYTPEITPNRTNLGLSNKVLVTGSGEILDNYLLLENSAYLLFENGGKIILE